jgi:hypothetical protein
MMKFGFSRTRHDPESTLQELQNALKTTLGEDIQAMLVYGDYVKPGRFDPQHSKLNLMLVLRRIDSELLDRIVAPITAAEQKVPMSTMTLTLHDLQTSCDVFPVKFRDIQFHHRLLCGSDVMAGLEFTDDHIRLRCEQEARNLMIRLRWAYLHHSQSAEELRNALLDAASQILPVLEASLSIRTGLIPELDADVAIDFAKEFGLKAECLVEVLQMRAGKTPTSADLKRLFNDFMQFSQDVAHAVDQLEVGQ